MMEIRAVVLNSVSVANHLHKLNYGRPIEF